MHCKQPSQVLPAIVHPTKCCTTHSFNNVVQPHIHPSHTTHVNHTNIQNQHYFPHTQSAVNQVTSTNMNMGPGPSVAGAFSPAPGPMPGQVAGAYSPGSAPGQVAGAFAPNMPAPGQVAGAFAPNMPAPGSPGFRKPGFGR